MSSDEAPSPQYATLCDSFQPNCKYQQQSLIIIYVAIAHPLSRAHYNCNYIAYLLSISPQGCGPLFHCPKGLSNR